MTHDEWIAAFAARHNGALLGRCRQAVAEMVAAFPELREVRGHVFVPGWGQRGHAWCVDASGAIVDPTRAQFPAVLAYEAWEPGDKVRAGTCRDCGDGIWAALQSLDDTPRCPDFCSEECAQNTLSVLNGGQSRWA